jgi:hypothetical protein
MLALATKTWSIHLLLAKAKSAKQQGSVDSGLDASKDAAIAAIGQDKHAYTSFSTRVSSGSVGSSQSRRAEECAPQQHGRHAISYESSFPDKKNATSSCPDTGTSELRNRFK